MVTSDQPVLVSFGGGTNSVAMLIELVARRERVDAILFADTGGEKPETYEYVDLFSQWLVDRDYPAITRVFHTKRDGTFETLEDECLRIGSLPSIAYGSKKCSGKFKIEPQDKWTNSWPMARAAWSYRVRIRKLIGFGVDERHRADKVDEYNDPKYLAPYLAGQRVTDIARSHAAPSGDEARDARAVANLARKIRYAVRYQKEYPLIEWGWGRDECVDAIDRAGLPRPGKSACFFCPSSKLVEIRSLSRPLQERAMAMEAAAKENLTSVVGLGRSFSWTDAINGNQTAEAPVSIPCECVDGDEWEQLDLSI